MLFKHEIMVTAIILLIYLCLVVSVDPNNKCNFEYAFMSQSSQGQAVETLFSPSKCYCGPSQVTLTYLSDQYCCIPPEDECTYDNKQAKAFCPSGTNGHVINK